MSDETALYELLAANQIRDDIALRLAEYGASVLHTNRRFNLTGAKNPVGLLSHILDALSILPFVGNPHVDVGSGAGFPAVPLALAMGLEVVLIESSEKKAGFLFETFARFGLRGQVVAQRAESLAHEPAFREHFASATARAVSSAAAVAELTVPFLRIGGVAVLQRGQTSDEEAEALDRAAAVLGADVTKTVASGPPATVFLVVKERLTPQRFPRSVGIPHRRPLGA